MPKKKSARFLAARIISEVLRKDTFANESLHNHFQKSGLNRQDKGFCTELVYGTLRWRLPLTQSLQNACEKPSKKINSIILPHMLVAAYQLQHLQETTPSFAIVNEAVANIKKDKAPLARFANAVLRNLGSPLHDILAENESDPQTLANAYGLPIKLSAYLVQHFRSQNLKHIFAAFNARPILWVRNFGKEDLDIAHPFVAGAFEAPQSGDVGEAQAFKDGQYLVQDPASQAAGILASIESGIVFDFCAAPGTKTATLCHALKQAGKVTAFDISEKRLEKLKENSERLHLKQIDIEICDLTKKKSLAAFEGQADSILLDAPCTAIGTSRRHPETLWRFSEEKLSALVKLQSALLQNTAYCLKPGGKLVYSVCSPLPEEGSLQIANFLENNPDFERDQNFTDAPYLKEAQNSFKEFHFFPHLHDADAFFACRLVRKS